MRITLVLVAVAALLVAAAPVSAKVRKLETKLSGANEMPAADPDGSGSAEVRLNRAKKKVCFEIRVRKIGQVVAAHIHKGGKSVASGPIVVPLIEMPSNKTRFTGREARQEVADQRDPQASAPLLRERPHAGLPGRRDPRPAPPAVTPDAVAPPGCGLVSCLALPGGVVVMGARGLCKAEVGVRFPPPPWLGDRQPRGVCRSTRTRCSTR